MYTYSYDITLKFITKDRNFIPTNSLKVLSKRFDYFTNFHPIFEAIALVNIRYLDPIRLNQDRIYAILNIVRKKRSLRNSNDEDIQYETLDEETVLTHTFIPYFTDDSWSNIVRQEDVTPDDTNGEKTPQSENPMYGMYRDLKMTLYSIDGLNLNKPIINFNAKDTDIGTAIKYAIHTTQKKLNEKPKVIIDMPDNEEKYNWLNVPGFNFSNTMNWLQTRYGVYKGGMNAFFDPPYLYVLNKFHTKHDYDKDLSSTIVLEDYIGNPVNQGMPTPVTRLKDGSTKYKIACSPIKQDRNVYFSELLGNELIYSNYALATGVYKMKNGEVSETKNPFGLIRNEANKHVKSITKQIMDYDEMNNPINQEALIKASNLGTVITLPRIEGIDIDTMRPNVSITLKIMDDRNKDAELSGIYTLMSGSLTFDRVNQQTDEFTCMARDIVLVKVD